MKRAIVTGATGAIGNALINELIDNNVEVLVFCREGSERNAKIPQNHLVSLKYCSLDQLCEIENDTGKVYDVFFHLAWDGTIGNFRNDMYLQNKNITYTLDAVEAAKRFGCSKFVGAGSQAEYGRVEGKLSADTYVHPENGYGIGKLCAGYMARIRAEQIGLQFNWIRVLSVYGPNDGMQSMVMSSLQKLKNGEVPKFTKGEQLWDYLYSRDAASAFFLIGDKGIDKKTYVLGSGSARALKEYIHIIRDCYKPEAEIELGAIPYSDKQVMHLCADISELTEDVGFTPKYSFEDGMKETIDWFERLL